MPFNKTVNSLSIIIQFYLKKTPEGIFRVFNLTVILFDLNKQTEINLLSLLLLKRRQRLNHTWI